ncbi:hypothetical protein ES288_D07G120800v1 [Gossypium darwinii]|uniref:RNase H type-1 domain-containing protein n=1 Tax=Gossypium darwinii TaxID=34276 RepID=A0A5D2BUV7_GOSDA|nr:hypothetical protein ES288_D07G120800v1 [Gossypium darwinii]
MASAKTLEHIFRDSISTSCVWAELHDWLLYDFTVHSISISRSVVCTLWLIWHVRNRQVRENTIVQIQEIIYRVWSYLLEFNAVHAKLLRRLIGPKRWRPSEGSCLKVNFDAAFHAPMLITCVGIVIKDNLGSVVGYTSIVTTQIPSAFAAEALACYHAI